MKKKRTYKILGALVLILSIIPFVSGAVGTGDAIVYGMATFVLLALIGMNIYFVIKSEKIWLKFLCGGFAYLLLVMISYFTWITSQAMGETAFIDVFFKWIFLILAIASFPLFLTSLVYYLYLLITLKPIKQMIDRGVPEDRIYANQIRRDLKRRGGLV